MAKVVTGLVRFSFQHVFTPKAPEGGGEPKYSVTCLLPKTDTQTLALIQAAKEQATQEGIQTKWNGAAPAVIPFPVHDGDGVRPNGEKFGPECAGCWVFTASSKQKPGVLDAQGKRIEMDRESEFYSGCYGRAVINFYVYNTAGKVAAAVVGVAAGVGAGMYADDAMAAVMPQSEKNEEPVAEKTNEHETAEKPASHTQEPNHQQTSGEPVKTPDGEEPNIEVLEVGQIDVDGDGELDDVAVLNVGGEKYAVADLDHDGQADGCYPPDRHLLHGYDRLRGSADSGRFQLPPAVHRCSVHRFQRALG